ncbi:MAG: hypothetical protein CMM28_12695 [Rhodospirillaceae bacterium]|nr:hypothetical protein [Rhodospirillaceae bacterium]
MRVDLIDTTSDFIPLALFYLKSYAETDPLIQQKTSINIVNPKNTLNIEDTAEEILRGNPDIIGFSCYIWNMENTVNICDRIKEIKPEITIIVGGPDVSSVPEKTLEKFPSIDVIVCGEGEETFRELIHYWENIGYIEININISSINGIAFRENNGIIITNKRPFIDELDIIPSPYLNGCVDLSNESRTILFETYRGCPFKCSFCYYPKDYGQLLHKFSMNRVEENIKEILSSNAKEIFLMDPTFNIPKKRAKEILKLIKKYRTNTDLSVTVELRVDLLDKEIMNLLKEANITVIEVGLQSSNIDVMSAVDRKQSTKLISENVKYMQNLGIETVIQLIYGLPNETTNTYLDSIDYGVSLDASKVEPYQLQLLPGTPMYKNSDLLGLNFVDDGERRIISTRTMSEREVEEAGAIAELVQVFYNNRVSRSALKWYSSYSGKTFSRIIEEYKEWRYELFSNSYVNWGEEGNYYIYDFFKYYTDSEFSALWPLLHDLNRFDYYTSHLNFIGETVFTEFQFDPVILLASPGVPTDCEPVWYRFRTDQQINSNFFNGQFLRKVYDKTDMVTAEIFNRDQLPDGFDSLEGILAAAQTALEQGESIAAEGLLRNALPAAPENSDLLHMLGLTVANGGLLDEAIVMLRRAVMANRDRPFYRVTLGAVYAEAERVLEAEREYRIALALDDRLAEAHFNLADLQSETDRLDDAVSSYQKALMLQPDLVEAHYNLGSVLNDLGRHDEAAKAHQRAIALAPELFDGDVKTQH